MVQRCFIWIKTICPKFLQTESFAETHLSNDNIGRQEREQQQIQRPIAFVVPNKRRRIQQPQQETMHSARSSQTFTSQQLPSEESVVVNILQVANNLHRSLQNSYRDQLEQLNLNLSNHVLSGEFVYVPPQFFLLSPVHRSNNLIHINRLHSQSNILQNSSLFIPNYTLETQTLIDYVHGIIVSNTTGFQSS
ncbi:unnamed protein product [Thelazia callipaeda]|uniref:Uncharacterized protein n=1 Tax=Thelazia callipaeda TaxID=103827 RepID=A0A3P7L9Z5_THECL|nr:unnamed protein product [Thelazia callipaeda]